MRVLQYAEKMDAKKFVEAEDIISVSIPRIKSNLFNP